MGKLPAETDHIIVALLKDFLWDVRKGLKDHIVSRLKDTDWLVRSSACETLGELPADELVKLKDSIVPLLKDRD